MEDHHNQQLENPNHNDDYFDNIPPGYKFRPTDAELINHYLRRKVNNQKLPRNQIIECNIYTKNPRQLVEEHRPNNEREVYFFTPRNKKYKNGGRPTRTAGNGYWKATGADKIIKNENGVVIGSRKALVFFEGKQKGGSSIKTSWLMYEYRLKDSPNSTPATTSDDCMRLDDCVLCKIYDSKKTVLQTTKNDEQPGNNTHIVNLPQKDEQLDQDNSSTQLVAYVAPNHSDHSMVSNDYYYPNGTLNDENELYHGQLSSTVNYHDNHGSYSGDLVQVFDDNQYQVFPIDHDQNNHFADFGPNDHQFAGPLTTNYQCEFAADPFSSNFEYHDSNPCTSSYVDHYSGQAVDSLHQLESELMQVIGQSSQRSQTNSLQNMINPTSTSDRLNIEHDDQDQKDIVEKVSGTVDTNGCVDSTSSDDHADI